MELIPRLDTVNFHLMEAIPLCDKIEVYIYILIYIYLFIYINTQQYSTIVITTTSE